MNRTAGPFEFARRGFFDSLHWRLVARIVATRNDQCHAAHGKARD
ncbi:MULTISPECIES: hypothetical protein [unclassified Fibrobacter]|nr:MULTISPECIES: hypothetical protein [unclassified Fibrobacter]